jgi:hypothetical protein
MVKGRRDAEYAKAAAHHGAPGPAVLHQVEPQRQAAVKHLADSVMALLQRQQAGLEPLAARAAM